ncbi:MAG TPA: sigma 54-interacting transcriptional regulator [Syntrophomonas sp.]|nr:sigma 54-interacting transcriptional regulator [Syntrophomonas sp.]
MNNPDLMLSSIIRNSEKSIIDQAIQPEDNLYIERVKQLKLEIIKGVTDPSEVGLIQSEIIESWLRSRNYGLEINQSPRTCPILSQADVEKLLVKNRFLINATLSSLRQFESLLNVNYDVFLFDPNGVNLLAMFGKNNNIAYERFPLAPGTIWNEKTIGTSSMSLVPILKRPIQCVGPENFLADFHIVTGSSAPIFDIKDDLAGILSIGTVYYQCVNSFNLSLVASIAALIQKEFQLTLYEEMYKVSTAASDEAMITIDNQGFITYVNQAAVAWFPHMGSNLIGGPLDSLLGNQSKIKKALKSGQSWSDSDMTIPGLGVCQCSVRPIKDHQGSRFGCLVAIKRGQTIPVTINGDPFAAIVGSSASIRETVSLARRFAECESNILLQGESGTGKELFARAIHNISRPNRPFVAVNCGAIPKNLAESELFGYEGGSFTGAERQGRQGKIEYAGNGTLFLDEIGDLPLDIQPILLRVLEEKQIVRVGGTRSIQANFQLIAATNKNLFDLMEKGLFREDLYYRLAVFKIIIPPLRERGQDTFLLSEHFLSAFAQKRGTPSPTLSRAAKSMLPQYSWPGNVRQLENCLIYAASIARGGVIRPEDLPQEIRCILTSKEEEATTHLEMERIRRALQKTEHNVSKAAQELGLSRATLYRKIRQYGL